MYCINNMVYIYECCNYETNRNAHIKKHMESNKHKQNAKIIK